MDKKVLLESLTPAQRMDMIMKGMSPVSPSDIKKYFNREQVSVKDKLERIQQLVGNSNNLGGANEKDFVPQVNTIYDESESTVSTKKNPQEALRRQLGSEMDSYVGNTVKVFETSDILSLRKKPLNESGGKTSAYQEGYNNAKAYLNAFVLNVQESDVSSSYKARLEIFKALKKCLEEEAKYKGDNQKLKEYRSGVLNAEKKVLS